MVLVSSKGFSDRLRAIRLEQPLQRRSDTFRSIVRQGSRIVGKKLYTLISSLRFADPRRAKRQPLARSAAAGYVGPARGSLSGCAAILLRYQGEGAGPFSKRVQGFLSELSSSSISLVSLKLINRTGCSQQFFGHAFFIFNQ